MCLLLFYSSGWIRLSVQTLHVSLRIVVSCYEYNVVLQEGFLKPPLTLGSVDQPCSASQTRHRVRASTI